MDIKYFLWLLIQYIKWVLYFIYHSFSETSNKQLEDTSKYDDL